MSSNGSNGSAEHGDVVVRKAERGWVVGDESVSDLTSAIVLADLFAADQADEDTAVLEAVAENHVPRRAAARASAPAQRVSDSGAHRLPTVSDGADVDDRSGESGEAERLPGTAAPREHAPA